MNAPRSQDVTYDPLVRVAVVVLTYGGGDNIAALLGRLEDEHIAAITDLIVVHNPSRPNETLALERPGRVRVIQLPVNRGYAGGMNAGIREALRARPEFVLLLTHDARIPATDVMRLCSLMSADPLLAAVGPILCGPDDAAYSTGLVSRHLVRMRHRVPRAAMPAPLWPCAGLDGSAMMWRARALDEVGGFDERYFMYFEDADISTRALRAGWRMAVATGVRVVSTPGGSSRRRAHAYLRARNGLGFAQTFGTRGLLAGLVECALELWFETPKPGGRRFRDADARRAAASYWTGTLLGLLDYFRGHWGPPPRSVLRDSDIAGT